MGLSPRSTSILCAFLALLVASTASAAATGSRSCIADSLKNGLRRIIQGFTKNSSRAVEVPAQYRATDDELAQAFSGNAQYKFLRQLFSEKSMARFRASPETVAMRNALTQGGKFEVRAGRLYAQGKVIRTRDNLRVVIRNVIIKGPDGEFHGFNTETDGLKTSLAKVLTGIYEGAHAIAAQHPELTHLEIVADEILNTKLAQALTHLGFYSKTLGRRLTDEEIKAVAVNKWFMIRNQDRGDMFVPEDLINYIRLESTAEIIRDNTQPQKIRFLFSDLLPVGDPTEERTRKVLSDLGYTKKDMNRILRVLSRRLTEDEELRYQQSR
ncbi:MAG: hypothetical protein ACJ763_06480 [Bdellovibrionia bacterium]